mmetsp:Transcript_194/g.282  ORF Transcript_194/g.282 Transcript_194/m.282 type:complete len:202 (+) Transcript_194:254-859(+)
MVTDSPLAYAVQGVHHHVQAVRSLRFRNIDLRLLLLLLSLLNSLGHLLGLQLLESYVDIFVIVNLIGLGQIQSGILPLAQLHSGVSPHLVWSCSRWADSDRLIAVLDGRQYATILQQEVGTEGVQSGHARVGKDCLCDGGNGLRRLAICMKPLCFSSELLSLLYIIICHLFCGIAFGQIHICMHSREILGVRCIVRHDAVC